MVDQYSKDQRSRSQSCGAGHQDCRRNKGGFCRCYSQISPRYAPILVAWSWNRRGANSRGEGDALYFPSPPSTDLQALRTSLWERAGRVSWATSVAQETLLRVTFAPLEESFALQTRLGPSPSLSHEGRGTSVIASEAKQSSGHSGTGLLRFARNDDHSHPTLTISQPTVSVISPLFGPFSRNGSRIFAGFAV